MPLKLVFKNVDPTADSFYSIYKIGDDLRQDMFVLQIINVMNQLWMMEVSFKFNFFYLYFDKFYFFC